LSFTASSILAAKTYLSTCRSKTKRLSTNAQICDDCELFNNFLIENELFKLHFAICTKGSKVESTLIYDYHEQMANQKL